MNRVTLIIKNASQILTMTGEESDSIGLLKNKSIAINEDKIIAIENFEKIINEYDVKNSKIINAEGKTVAPGFVDCHTHTVFGGSRVKEYAAKVFDSSPEYLKEKAIETGVMVSVNMTRDASINELISSTKEKISSMISSGTTTLEIKSGYGLDTENELKILEVIKKVNDEVDIDIISTFLGAHGWPENKTKEEYIDEIINNMLPIVAKEKLATFHDVWIEDSHFDTEDTRRMIEASNKYGLLPKVHTDAYSYIGGSDLAAEMKMVSADHLNYTPKSAIHKMANAGVIGVVMPSLDFAVAHKKPFNARELIDEGLEIALATNLNPGNWTESMQFVMVLATRLYGMKTEEAIRSATLIGAKALAIEDKVGSIELGKNADIQIWDTEDYNFVIYKLGSNIVHAVIKDGEVIFDNTKGDLFND